MTQAGPRVSVVIPAYNAEGFITKTLDSVRNQTFRDYEIIVVDDGSSDGTNDIVSTFLADHSLKGRCIRQENRGIAAARNIGMGAAIGILIALLDHDDIWYPAKLERVLAEFDRHPEAVWRELVPQICVSRHLFSR